MTFNNTSSGSSDKFSRYGFPIEDNQILQFLPTTENFMGGSSNETNPWFYFMKSDSQCSLNDMEDESHKQNPPLFPTGEVNHSTMLGSTASGQGSSRNNNNNTPNQPLPHPFQRTMQNPFGNPMHQLPVIKEEYLSSSPFGGASSSSPIQSDMVMIQPQGVATPNNNNNNNNTPSNNSTASKVMHITAQPKPYQVVNYNVWPSPMLQFGCQLDRTVKIYATLCVVWNHRVIELANGFTKGFQEELRWGDTELCFTNLHLNLMTPIKSTLTQAQVFAKASKLTYCIKFHIKEQPEVQLITDQFRLVSAASKIPRDVVQDLRPRVRRPDLEGATPNNNSQLTPSTPSSSGRETPTVLMTGKPIKRRAPDEMSPQSDQIFLNIHMRNRDEPLGFIVVDNNETLQASRKKILEHDEKKFPTAFRFFFPEQRTVVGIHQEQFIPSLRVAGPDRVLYLEAIDEFLESVHASVLALWLSSGRNTVPLQDILATIFEIQVDRDMWSHEQGTFVSNCFFYIFANIGNKNSHSRTLEDLKTFLKLFGPAERCLRNVERVYNLPYFHGFISRVVASDLIRKKPGAFVVRFSESKMDNGCFAFNVNKGRSGNSGSEQISNFLIQWRADHQAFFFEKKAYQTLDDFVRDPKYAPILREGIPRDSESAYSSGDRYSDETELSTFMLKMSLDKNYK